MAKFTYVLSCFGIAPKVTTEKLQRVLNSAARGHWTSKFDRGLLRLLQSELHWLDIREWALFKLVVMFG